MISWIILAVALVAVFFVVKMSHFNRKYSIVAGILVFAFIALTFIKVAGANSIILNNASGVFSGVKTYFFWIGQVFDNITTLTGNAVKMDWFAVR